MKFWAGTRPAPTEFWDACLHSLHYFPSYLQHLSFVASFLPLGENCMRAKERIKIGIRKNLCSTSSPLPSETSKI